MKDEGLSLMRAALRSAFMAGFFSSSQGYNGEHWGPYDIQVEVDGLFSEWYAGQLSDD